MLRALLVVTVLVAAMPAHAERSVIVGAGIGTCGEMGKLYRQSPDEARTLYNSWSQGFLTAMNLARGQLGLRETTIELFPPGWNADRQWRYLMRYCNQHPLAQFIEAVDALLQELYATNNAEP
jgi:hypothetical protein